MSPRVRWAAQRARVATAPLMDRLRDSAEVLRHTERVAAGQIEEAIEALQAAQDLRRVLAIVATVEGGRLDVPAWAIADAAGKDVELRWNDDRTQLTITVVPR